MPTCVRNRVDAQCHLLVDACFSSLSFRVASGCFTEAVTFVMLIIRKARQFSLWRRVDVDGQIHSPQRGSVIPVPVLLDTMCAL